MKKRQKIFLLAVLAIIAIAAGAGWYEQKHMAFQISQTYQLRYQDGAVCGLDLNGMEVSAFYTRLGGKESQVISLPLTDGNPELRLGGQLIQRVDGRWDFADQDTNLTAKDREQFVEMNMTDVHYSDTEQLYYGIQMLKDGRQVPAFYRDTVQTISQVVYSKEFHIKRWCRNVAVGLLVLISYAGLIELFAHRKKGFPVWGKMILITAPILLLGYAGLNVTIRAEVEQEIKENRTQLLLDRALTQRAKYNLKGVRQFADYGDNLRFYYIKENEIYSEAGGYLPNVPMSSQCPDEIMQEIRQVVETGEIVAFAYSSDGESYDSVMIPVIDDAEKTVGVIETVSDVREHMVELAERIQELQLRIFGISIVLLITVLAIVIFNMRLLDQIRLALEAAGKGNLEVRVPARGQSESAVLGRAFNHMLSGIEAYISDLGLFYKKYRAFVPQEEIQAMGRKDVRSVEMGDECELKAAILTIKQYDSVGEEEKEMKNSVTQNERWSRQIRRIREYGGIIHSFKENGMDCLYPKNPSKALEGAVTYLQQEGGYNCHFGISYGQVRLGIMGEEERAAIVMVSEEEGLSNFLTEKAVEYGASLLVTDKFFREAEDTIISYHYRCLGYVCISLSGRLAKIYEILDGEPGERRQKKNSTKADFEAGVDAYMAGDYELGRRLFVKVLRENREDQAARHYIYLCDGYLRNSNAADIHPYLDVY